MAKNIVECYFTYQLTKLCLKNSFQQLRRDIDHLDSWINYREPVVHDKEIGNNIDAVEEQLRKHEDFEKTVAAQDEKFNAIKRRTLVCTFTYIYYMLINNKV